MMTITQEQVDALSSVLCRLMELPSDREEALKAARLAIQGQDILLAIEKKPDYMSQALNEGDGTYKP